MQNICYLYTKTSKHTSDNLIQTHYNDQHLGNLITYNKLLKVPTYCSGSGDGKIIPDTIYTTAAVCDNLKEAVHLKSFQKVNS